LIVEPLFKKGLEWAKKRKGGARTRGGNLVRVSGEIHRIIFMEADYGRRVVMGEKTKGEKLRGGKPIEKA